MKSLTGLVKVQKKLAKKGLVILALNRYPNETEPEVLQTARHYKWSHPIYYGADLGNFKLKANPQVFIFNHAGKMVFDPKGIDYVKDAGKHAAKAPDWLVGAKEFKALRGQARRLAGRRDLGKLVVELEASAKRADAAEKEEARFLLARCKWYTEWMQGRVKERIAAGYPSAALKILGKIAAQFRGHAIGIAAGKDLVAKRTSADFKKEILAEKAARIFEKIYYTLDFHARNADEDVWRKKSAKTLAKLNKLFVDFSGKYGGTGTFKRLEGLMEFIED